MLSVIYNYKYLTRTDLAGFDKYQYKSVDNSPLSNYVMHPFWNQLVKVVPLSISANILTLVGWLNSLLIFVVLSYYDPHFMSSSGAKTVPSWVWLLSAFCTFSAHQLDGIDGKQARRTNSGSPLGELFDHGLDSSTVVFMTLGIISLFGLSDQTVWHWEIVLITYVVLGGFWAAHWEKYSTSVLFLPWAYDVSQICLAGAYLISYIYGIDIWKGYLYGYSLPIIFKLLLYSLVVGFCIPMCIYNQYIARKNRPADCVDIIEGMMPVVCLVSVTFLYTGFGYFSSSKIVESHLRLFLLGYGILYSNIICRLIMSQMMGGICDRFNILALPLIPMIILSQLQLVPDKILLVVYVCFLTVAHLHYGVNLVRQICLHLNIHCFKLGKRSVKLQANGNSQTNGLKNGTSYSNGTVYINGKTAVE